MRHPDEYRKAASALIERSKKKGLSKEAVQLLRGRAKGLHLWADLQERKGWQNKAS